MEKTVGVCGGKGDVCRLGGEATADDKMTKKRTSKGSAMCSVTENLVTSLGGGTMVRKWNSPEHRAD